MKLDPREIGCDDVDWIHMAQDRKRWLALHDDSRHSKQKSELHGN